MGRKSKGERELETQQKQFNTFYERAKQQVDNTIQAFIKDEAEQENLAQDVWLKVWSNIDNWANIREPNSWVRRLAINTCIDYLRAQEDVELVDQVEELPSKQRADDLLRESLAMSKLNQIIEKIPIKYIEMLISKNDGHTIREIALTYGTTEGTVRDAIYKTRKQLKQAVAQ